MAKKINITDKLELSGNPCLVIGNTELQVNADAATVLKLMEKYREADASTISVNDMMDIYNLIFQEESRNEISHLNLSFADFKVVIEEAMNLVMDVDGTDEGEVQTHTTT